MTTTLTLLFTLTLLPTLTESPCPPPPHCLSCPVAASGQVERAVCKVCPQAIPPTVKDATVLGGCPIMQVRGLVAPFFLRSVCPLSVHSPPCLSSLCPLSPCLSSLPPVCPVSLQSVHSPPCLSSLSTRPCLSSLSLCLSALPLSSLSPVCPLSLCPCGLSLVYPVFPLSVLCLSEGRLVNGNGRPARWERMRLDGQVGAGRGGGASRKPQVWWHASWSRVCPIRVCLEAIPTTVMDAQTVVVTGAGSHDPTGDGDTLS